MAQYILAVRMSGETASYQEIDRYYVFNGATKEVAFPTQTEMIYALVNCERVYALSEVAGIVTEPVRLRLVGEAQAIAQTVACGEWTHSMLLLPRF